MTLAPIPFTRLGHDTSLYSLGVGHCSLLETWPLPDVSLGPVLPVDCGHDSLREAWPLPAHCLVLLPNGPCRIALACLASLSLGQKAPAPVQGTTFYIALGVGSTAVDCSGPAQCYCLGMLGDGLCLDPLGSPRPRSFDITFGLLTQLPD